MVFLGHPLASADSLHLRGWFKRDLERTSFCYSSPVSLLEQAAFNVLERIGRLSVLIYLSSIDVGPSGLLAGPVLRLALGCRMTLCA